MEKIPIINLIDLGDLTTLPDKNNIENFNKWKIQAKEIRSACGEMGFLQLINHGIPKQSVEDVFEQSKLFFELSLDSKTKYQKPKISSVDSYFGYNSPGQENVSYHGKAVFEFRETYDWIEGRGIYPDEELPKFEKKINTLNEHCKHLAKKILQLWAIGMTNIRLAHYPKISDDIDLPEGTVRISEHSDYCSLTFLFQDNAGGLEAKNVNGNWIPVDPIPDAIVLNTGDLLEFWTSGLFPATPHRVLIPATDAKKRLPRYSIAYFSGPDTTETVTPLKMIRTSEEEKRIALSKKIYSSEPVIALDHVMNKLKTSYDTAYMQE